MVISVEKSDRANRLGIGRMTTDQILDDTILFHNVSKLPKPLAIFYGPGPSHDGQHDGIEPRFA